MRTKLATYLKKHTMSELARTMGITPTRVHQLANGTQGEKDVWVELSKKVGNQPYAITYTPERTTKTIWRR